MESSVTEHLLPVELWRDIFLRMINSDFSPCEAATIFNDMDVFSHPCKIYFTQGVVTTTLRLVCRLWNDIVNLIHMNGIIRFIDSAQIDKIEPDLIQFSRRLEIIHNWTSEYCHKWPCPFTTRESGRCPGSMSYYHSRGTDVQEAPFYEAEQSLQITVLRLFQENRDPSQLLRKCQNLEALWVHDPPFRGFLRKDETFASHHFQHLSHLHLHGMKVDGNTYTLHLPRLVYLDLILDLSSLGPVVFPLEIRMPNITTISLGGRVGGPFFPSIEQLILSACDTLTNLFLLFELTRSDPNFPVEMLASLPKLAILGHHIRTIENYDTGNPSIRIQNRLSLVLFGLETSVWPEFWVWELRRFPGEALMKLFLMPKSSFNKLIVPLQWSELHDLWVQSCEKSNLFADKDELPANWINLDIAIKNGVTVEDRDGVACHEGTGAAFVNMMTEYSAKVAEAQKRKSKKIFGRTVDGDDRDEGRLDSIMQGIKKIFK
ncbi:hypothetical protein FRC18_001015 [Serendipita sp. 400]|nr:hypothetical protein FRC18_001015 [Serendipita sp. 400]